VGSCSPTAPALAELYGDHHGWLQQLLRQRLGCNEAAADLAQDAFLRLLMRPRRFDSFNGARAYLSRMAHGLCVDLWRRQSLEQAWRDALARQPADTAPSPEQGALILELLWEVDAMLARLPDRVAEAFLLSQLQGWRYREIAAHQGVSERSVRKYMARAMLHCALLEAGLEDAPA